MFVGHLALALSGKTVSRETSLVWFMIAANLVDLLWPLFLIAGIERVRIDPGNTAFTPLAFDWAHGHVALWSFVLLSSFLWATSPFSPPPPSEHALALFALFGWTIVPWAWWIERTSDPR